VGLSSITLPLPVVTFTSGGGRHTFAEAAGDDRRP